MAEYYEGYDYYNDPMFNTPVGSQEDQPWNYPMSADYEGIDYYNTWGRDAPTGSQADQPWNYPMPADTEGGGGNWFTNLLGGAGSLAGSLFGQGGAGGPLLSALGSLGGGAIGSNAANEAARLQSQALNRGIDLQTAQWLQQQGNLAPYLQAGQGGLAQLQQLAGREQPGLPGAMPGVNGANYGLPSAAPGWMPQTFTGPQGPNAGDYRWTPQAGPQAANFRYTPGAVPTLSGQELLANDPGYQFRMNEARKALEGSAAARGDLLSGQNLKALQSRSQDLASQEYGNAWNRAAEQARLREQWQQYATSQGWNQAQAEAAWREQMAQQASQQGFNQALAGQQNQFTQGITAQQWNQQQAQKYEQDLYARTLEQSKYRYGQDVTQNQTDYDRAQALYRQRLGAYMLPWEQQSTLAGLGGKAVGMYGEAGQSATNAISNLLGQYGVAQATGPAASGNIWNRALTSAGTQIPGILAGLNA